MSLNKWREIIRSTSTYYISSTGWADHELKACKIPPTALTNSIDNRIDTNTVKDFRYISNLEAI